MTNDVSRYITWRVTRRTLPNWLAHDSPAFYTESSWHFEFNGLTCLPWKTGPGQHILLANPFHEKTWTRYWYINNVRLQRRKSTYSNVQIIRIIFWTVSRNRRTIEPYRNSHWNLSLRIAQMPALILITGIRNYA